MKEHLKEYKKRLENEMCEYMEQPANERYATVVEHFIACWKAVDMMEHLLCGDTLDTEHLAAWNAAMKNADGTTGGHYTVAQTTAAANTIGVQFTEITDKEWNATMNMMYSDYSPVAQKFNAKAPDFYAELAKAFLFDKDGGGPKQKLSEYYMNIVKS